MADVFGGPPPPRSSVPSIGPPAGQGPLAGMMGSGFAPGPVPVDPMALLMEPALERPAMEPSPPAEGIKRMEGRVSPPPERLALVNQWQSRVTAAKAFWKPVFDRMEEDRAFVAGRQWPGSQVQTIQADWDNYVANVTLRHIQQATASLYGKNPTIVAHRRKRLCYTVWDGTMPTLMMAQQKFAAGEPDPETMAILVDVARVQQERLLYQRIGDTLVALYNYNILEQAIPFKTGLKGVVRKALTTGVGYIKLGYQRTMKRRPEVEQQIADASERLSTIQTLGDDLAEGTLTESSAETEQLRLTIQALTEDMPMLVREGLTVDYPDSTKIIPDTCCVELRNFVGCRWVAEEFLLTADEIKEVYNVDVGRSSAVSYVRQDALSQIVNRLDRSMGGETEAERAVYAVHQIYSRPDGIVYTSCEGYDDFLEEPRKPDVWLERFWPWFVFVKNEVYHAGSVFPPSDVRLIRDPQMEINRARQGLREQRRANRPKIASPAGMLNDEDKEKLQNHPANALIELQALAPGQKVEDVLQPIKMPGIDPNLYDTTPGFEDIMRVVGTQEANLGGTSNATATESSIAEGSRMTSSASEVDDLDMMLTEFARAAGQVLLVETSPETVTEIVGPGAVWPKLSKEQIAKEVFLEVEAASTGRPNKAAETQNFQALAPLLMQIPGVSPDWLAREAIRRMNDRMDPEDAIISGMPSMASMNRQAQAGPGGPGAGSDPNAQGDKGAGNTPGTEPPQVNAAPRPPEGPTAAAAGAIPPGQMLQ